jgi:hypothetical protein
MERRFISQAIAVGLLSVALLFSGAAHASKSTPDVHSYLTQFHAHPKQTMDTPPSSDQVTNKSMSDEAFRAHDLIRRRLCAAAGRSCDPEKISGYWEINGPSQISHFLYEENYLKTLLEMEKLGLRQVVLKTPPWSDSYWPLKLGLIGRRWLDSGFPNSHRWLDNYNYILSVPASLLSINKMSPAEKYDILVGDSSYRLTNAVWGEGKLVASAEGFTPSWAGLCHGWSPAAIMTPTPNPSVEIQSANGQMMTFYPSDIKALAAMAWGASPPKLNLAGTRCPVRHPREDEVGRVTDERCRAVNPATWHIGIVNQLGVDKRSFVVDANYDLEVWNFPVAAYQYQYFNPQTLTVSDQLSGSVVKASEFTIDKFKKYRSPDAKYFVGISMDMTYVIPIQPSTHPNHKSLTHTIKYVYDLELNQKGEIIGGEWYSNFHPGFIWNLPPGSHTLSKGEYQIGVPFVWDGSGPVSPQMRAAALISSPEEQPLAAVVETLETLAQ